MTDFSAEILRYSEQLNHIEEIYLLQKPIDQLKIKCPLCFDDFEVNSGNLSVEHVPPKSLGGKKIVVTCKSCNNKAGSSIESHLKAAFQYSIDRNLPENTKIAVDIDFGQKAKFSGSILRKSKDDIQLIIQENNNNPNLIELFNRRIYDNDRTFNVNPKTRHKILNERVIISLLKTAYLQIFWRFGYAPIFDPYFQPLRDQINYPETIIYPLQLTYIINDDIPFKNGVNVAEFESLRFLISSFRLQLGNTEKQYNILIPLMHTRNGIASDTAYLFYYLKRRYRGQIVNANNISNTDRPVLFHGDEIHVTKQLITDIYFV